ncbi:hypothetical protein [Actinoalloteichus hymeniacidonis]|uniref:Uncharacterized protein n=1 Tax=Actinoalloteichus hymeniacidonis TaxID=340345 RepID=A0AAC9HL73_9PSEU|nr:hypothetical protein [Actinoalloteichus hymeniacidonis]AOS61209.1 hypothetical protein TL08_01850 [Actinoalloteichus hymeniacidonis]MBB5910789.1 hypothetical protein [Actinoalloteichus hymeniacidonis]
MIYPDAELFSLIPADLRGRRRSSQRIAITVDRSAHRVLLELGFSSAGLAALNPTTTRSLIDNIDLRQPGETRLRALGPGLAPRVVVLTVYPGVGIDLAVLGERAPRDAWRIGLDRLPRLVIALVDAINLVDPYPLPTGVEPLPTTPTGPIEFRRRIEPSRRARQPRILRAGR